MDHTFTGAVITVSDRSAAGEREDLSGPAAAELLAEAGFHISARHVVPDEQKEIEDLLRRCVNDSIALVVTTGGTGFAPRDVTPEATRAVIERQAEGLAEAMRTASLAKTKFALLSRGVCGIAGQTLILNLPGSPKAVRECLEVVLPVVPHGLALLRETGDAGH